MILYETIKNYTIEEMADFVAPMFNECYKCENEEKCEQCTEEKQRQNIINILKTEQ